MSISDRDWHTLLRLTQSESLSAVARQHTPYEEHRDYVLAVLRQRCGWLDPSDREALLHDAYAVFLEKQRDGRLNTAQMRAGQIRAYLTQTALNKAMDEGKRAGRRRNVSLDDENLGIDPADPGRGLDERLDARFDEARVREIVAELPERQQLIVKLRFLFDRSPQEIQRYMAITERVYRRELERATRRLAERYEQVRTGTFCESRRSLILAYVTGVAGPNRMDQARRHLDSCPACARWAVELRMAARGLAAVVPAPFLLPLHTGARGRIVSAGHVLRTRASDLAAGAWQHTTRGLVSANPSRLAFLASARPGTVAVLVTGCIAGGSTVTYCVTNGVPAPLRSFLSVTGNKRSMHAKSASRHEHSRRGSPPRVTLPNLPASAFRPQADGRLIQALNGRRDPSPPRLTRLARSAAPGGDGVAERVNQATAPEFGAGGFAPASSSSPRGGAGETASSSPGAGPTASTSKPLPEFDP